MSNQFTETEITSDDKLFAALCYLPFIFPLVSILVLFLQDKKNRPFIRLHAVQSLSVGLVLFVLSGITACSGFLVTIPIMLYFAYKAYQGEAFTIPVITDFIKNQGWI